MTRSVQLRPAEVLLFEVMNREHQQATEAALRVLKERTAAIYLSHELPLNTEGMFQVDPLDRSVVTFIYDDGTPPAEQA